MNLTTTLRIIRASAIYDILATSAFALPITAGAAFSLLGIAQTNLGLSGTLPSTDALFTVFFANLTGSLVLIWSILRLWRPSLLLGAADAGARALFSLSMAFALIAGGTPLLWGFLVLELAWGCLQAFAVVSASLGEKSWQPIQRRTRINS